MYVITTESRYNKNTLFLVDRSKFAHIWWTEHLSQAVVFKSAKAATAQCSKIKYNKPEVVTLERAILIDKDNDLERDRRDMYYDHPFSSEALGQE